MRLVVVPDRHDLARLFGARSVAVLGASGRPGKPGYQVLQTLQRVGRSGLAIYPVTPRYEQIDGLTCYPDMASVPPVDVAVIASAPARVETEVEAAIEKGADGIVIFGAPGPGRDREGWIERIAGRCRESETHLLGPDTIGFFDFENGCGMSWAFPDQIEPGPIAVISQSGTVFWEAVTSDPRNRFSLCAHTGLEATLTIAELIEYSLSLRSTRAIGIYLETVRDPEAFATALERASDVDVPVVALYAGESEGARAQMLTHAGRMAGDRRTLEALFRRHRVLGVKSSDEWWTTLSLLSAERSLGSGSLAVVMDSGGGLAMFHDQAEALDVPLARLDGSTRRRLQELLGTDEPVDSALDFWVGDSDRHSSTEEVISVLSQDEDVAGVLAFTTFAEWPGAGFAERVARACIGASRRTDKLIAAATYTSRQLYPDLMGQLSKAGLPVLDGMRSAVEAFRHAFEYRTLGSLGSGTARELEASVRQRWTQELANRGRLWEADALSLFADVGVPCVDMARVTSEEEAVAAARGFGYPVVLKTDERIAHKAARGGVALNLQDEEAVREAFRHLNESLGPRAVVSPMVSGIELAVGVVASDYGPVVMVGAGGTMIETLDDQAYLLAPVSADEVAHAMRNLSVTRCLKDLGDGVTQRVYELVAQIAMVATQLEGSLLELDINPILVDRDGCIAVDGLVAGRGSDSR